VVATAISAALGVLAGTGWSTTWSGSASTGGSATSSAVQSEGVTMAPAAASPSHDSDRGPASTTAPEPTRTAGRRPATATKRADRDNIAGQSIGADNTAAVRASGVLPQQPARRTPTTAVAATRSSGGLTTDQRRRADQLTSVFENSTPTLQYAYAEDIGDGRGITSGRAGFCTGTGDALVVVKRYTARRPSNALVRFLPELRRLADTASARTTGLPAAAYEQAWRRAAADPTFRQVQDQVVDEMYFQPATQRADRLGLKTALAKAQLYDTAIQHGVDGLDAIIATATKSAGGTPVRGVGERRWLRVYLAARLAVLRADSAWADSVDRVHAYESLLAAGDLDLRGPIRVSVYGDHFTIA
jgi:chitosanase